ncbi:MAG: Holliday junction branch migration protein RuvA [Pirellulales bacterium]|nr:Holliday junction branch migration protein RuvA [Pirellulales bacterium]HJN64839.1 Holliday junction branch migration protein RuvA [Pirellulales bacterium]
MITKIKGLLLSVGDDALTLAVEAYEYQIYIPDFARRQLQSKVGKEISLHTVHYLEGNPMQGKLTPRMIGFLNDAEREFFELFCSVDGVGVKKALRAMVRPVRDVATAIEEQDTKSLSGLPGIGPATAERIVAKLRRKVPKFALMASQGDPRVAEVELDVVGEGVAVLLSLGHSEKDARRLLDTALAKKKKYSDVESLLQAVYEQGRG